MKLEVKLNAAIKLLKQIKETAENSEHWWMASPDRGGIDVEAIDKILEGVDLISIKELEDKIIALQDENLNIPIDS